MDGSGGGSLGAVHGVSVGAPPPPVNAAEGARVAGGCRCAAKGSAVVESDGRKGAGNGSVFGMKWTPRESGLSARIADVLEITIDKWPDCIRWFVSTATPTTPGCYMSFVFADGEFQGSSERKMRAAKRDARAAALGLVAKMAAELRR